MNRSESEAVPDTGSQGSEIIDRVAQSFNIGEGQQYNYYQTGTGNAQYNAQTQTFHNVARASTKKQKIAACQHALLASRPEYHREALISTKGKRVDGTCEWIRSDKEYQALLSGETQLLWIQGGPGKGKTMLSIFLTQDLEKHQNVIYFFCQADDERRRNASYVLRSLLWQLSVQQPAIAEHLIPDPYPPEGQKVTVPDRENMRAILMKIAKDSRLSTTICLVDGLDECDEDSQRWLAMKLLDPFDASEIDSEPGAMRVIVVSRPNVSTLNKSRHIKFDPDNNENTSHDIKRFVGAKVRELSSKLDNIPDASRAVFHSQMEIALLDRADGTFLWIGFAMEELMKAETWTEMETAVRGLPKGLPALYDRMLLRIDPRHRSTTFRVLHCIAMAARPLSLVELGAFIGSRAHGSMSAEQATFDQITICGLFVRISEGTVALVHETAREYLLGGSGHNIAAFREFHKEISSIHQGMTISCLTSIEQAYKRNESTLTAASTLPSTTQDVLLSYAILHWPEHARQSHDIGD